MEDTSSCFFCTPKQAFQQICGRRSEISGMQMNHCQHNEEKPEAYSSEKAREIAEKLKSAKKGLSDGRDEHCTIPNIISALAARHNSLNYLNIWDLTVYQLFDLFLRQSVINQLDILGMNCAAWGGEYPFNEWYKKIN